MKDHETPEAVKAPAEQEDPIVMYLIYHEGIGMGTGKACAQSGHAAVMVTLDYFELKDRSRSHLSSIKCLENSACVDEDERQKLLAALRSEYSDMSRKLSIFGEWLKSSYRKVTLTANDKEWAKIKAEPMYKAMVIDAGLTEIPAGSETFIGLWPMRKSQRPKCVQRLQALK